MRAWERRSVAGLLLAVTAWALLADLLLPAFWRHPEHDAGLAAAPDRTTDADGIPGDPPNVGLVGTREEVGPCGCTGRGAAVSPSAMGIVAITGSSSGIGAETRAWLERGGDRVVGVDLHGAEVVADLSAADGRRDAVARVREACGGRLAGLVVCAGLGPHVEPASAIASVNYFGAVALLDGLRDALVAGRPAAAIAICSNSATLTPDIPPAYTDALLAGDEAHARGLADGLEGSRAYAGSKLALARAVRRRAPGWAAAGVRLNGIAPGPVLTPLLEKSLEHPQYGPAIRGFPVPAGGFGTAPQIAAAVAWLLGPQAGFCVGSILFVDGGTDALVRPDAL